MEGIPHILRGNLEPVHFVKVGEPFDQAPRRLPSTEIYLKMSIS